MRNKVEINQRQVLINLPISMPNLGGTKHSAAHCFHTQMDELVHKLYILYYNENYLNKPRATHRDLISVKKYREKNFF